MNPAPSPSGAPYTVVGRYAIFDEIASGGMATVHLGRLLGAAGFSRTVAVKKLHPQFARDQEFATMFMDEAHLASRINHPNVVQTLDVVPDGKDILLVMEYVHGAPFAHLLGTARRAGLRVPPPIIAGVMVGVLEGLHAAHEVRNESGAPLGVVHRDVSPQNVIVGVEGVPRVIDFGVAKAMGKMHATREGQLKGKLCYMSPEQVRGTDVTRLSDVFSASIVLWEALMAERLFDGKNPAELIMQVLSAPIRSPRSKFPDLPPALEAVVMRGLSREPAGRFPTAREMAKAIESAVAVAPAREVAAWVESIAGPALAQRAKLLEAIERAVMAASSNASGEHRMEALQAAFAEAAKDRAALSSESSGSISKPDAERQVGLDSGPRERTPAPTSDDRPLGFAFEAAAPKLRSERPAAFSSRPPAPLRKASDVDAQAPTLPPPADSAMLEAALGGPLGQPPAVRRMEGAAPAPIVHRPHRIPTLAAPPPRAGLMERLAWPIRLVVAGVLISLVDFALRLASITFAVRPLWAAEILVVGGVIWAFVGLFVSREE